MISALALPFGVLVLFSFGGQLVFGPFVLAIEWILARISARPLCLAWSFLGAALAGEIIYLVLDIHVQRSTGSRQSSSVRPLQRSPPCSSSAPPAINSVRPHWCDLGLN